MPRIYIVAGVAYERRVENLIPVIGEQASRLAVDSDRVCGLGGLLFLLVFLPFCFWAELGGPAAAWVPASIGGIGGVGVLGYGIFLARRSARFASKFVSERFGYQVSLPSYGYRRDRWEGAIERATHRP